ncbi:hypothetical protein K0817_017145 [Microbacterium sp. HD4P20]|uniref:hypothetical protein n=1 Tax=Microbacterium sp. HD4P20 TaxID=2864874 RepID=UPI001C644315|nr:hypothetical protein [Microbacterium sp. HD4P20]MCP2638283.1 hypothetical protein [Microbacterium sp. HD4P20]
MSSTVRTSSPARSGYRLWFLVDGLVTGANAVLYLLLNQLLPELIGGTSPLYLTVGIFLLVVTVGLLVVARSGGRPAALAWVLVVINFLWAVASFVIAAVNPFGLNGFGVAWTVAQGLIVLAFGIFQARALRTSPRG